ncbi:MAG TPA: phosphatidate cytidylyltransferase [Gemmataceae bacterium]|nr:phosphatidate cytidylyltransferase [Pirellulales bacterium]HZZ77246.1 phosphatidate cytidylyltransferase [Gemmataceae bacterium]
MLRWRITLGVIFSAAIAALCWADAQAQTPGTWLLPLVVGIALLATDELSRMLAARAAAPLGIVTYVGNGAIVLAAGASHWWPQATGDSWSWPALALAGAMIAAIAEEVYRYREPARQTERLAAAALALVYIGLLLSFAVQLRFVEPVGAVGLGAIASLILVVKMCDIGAYTVGRLIGRHKMAPHLSPGKTIEGAVGGLAFAVFAAWLSFVVICPRLESATARQIDVWQWLGFGITVGAAGMLGDLAESLLKRDLGRKDSSTWMPGFGGVLDLLDSILVAAPVAYVWWEYLL